MFKGIKPRLILWVAAISIPALVAGALSFTMLSTEMRHAAENRLLFLLKSESTRIQAILDAELNSIKQLTDKAPLRRLVEAHLLTSLSDKAPKTVSTGYGFGDINLAAPQPLQALSEQLLSEAKSANPNVHALQILGKRGTVLGQTSEFSFTRDSEDSKATARRTKTPKLEGVWHTQPGSTLAGVVAPILDQKRRFIGFLMVEVRIDALVSSLRIYEDLGETTEALLVRDAGNYPMLMHTPRFGQTKVENAGTTESFSALLSRSLKTMQSQLARVKDYRGRKSIAAFTSIPNADWGLVIKIDESEVLAPVQGFGVTLIIAYGLSGLIVLTGFFLYIRPLSQRIKHLSMAAEKISHRDFDFSIPDNSKDEIGTLSIQINKLAAEFASDTNLVVAVQEQLHYRDTRDEESGLLNRDALNDHLTAMQQVSADCPVSTLAIEFNATPINSDQATTVDANLLVAHLGKLIKEILPAHTYAARWSANVFVLLLPEFGNNAAALLQQEVDRHLGGPLSIGGHKVGVTLHHGSATVQSENELKNLVQYAIEEVMHQKQKKSDQSDVCLNTAKLVEQAIRDDRIDVWYQPIVRFTKGSQPQLSGAEALVRIRSESGEILPADAFMPHIQHHPVGALLDRVVADRALTDVNSWTNQSVVSSQFTVSLNLTCRTLKNLEMAKHLNELSKKLNAGLQNLILEISSVSMSDHVNNIAAYKAMGVKLAVDDIGVQNFSVSQLKSLQPDFVKINWNKISREATTPDALNAEHFLKLLGFFNSLNISIVAKNIETKGQRLAMNHHGINLMQGYLIGAATNATTFIQQWGEPPELRKAG